MQILSRVAPSSGQNSKIHSQMECTCVKTAFNCSQHGNTESKTDAALKLQHAELQPMLDKVKPADSFLQSIYTPDNSDVSYLSRHKHGMIHG